MIRNTIKLIALAAVFTLAGSTHAADKDGAGSIAASPGEKVIPPDNANPDPEELSLIQRHEADPSRFSELYRPQYHFTSISGGANDPNGLCFFNGQWHFFHQGGRRGLVWAHAISMDLLHWKFLPSAIVGDQFGVPMSGSGLVDHHNVSGLFSHEPGMMLYYSWGRGKQNEGRERQCLAYSQDGKLFVKHPQNPIIPELRYQEGMGDEAGFRDPKVFWHKPSRRFIMIIGGDGPMRLYSSSNMVDWKFESTNKDIRMECPDMFELPVDSDSRKLLWVVSQAGRQYYTGTFDGKTFTPTSKQMRLAWGHDAYASQSWSDVPDGRRIWTTKICRAHVDPQHPPYMGRMPRYVPFSIPMELSLATTQDGVELLQNPAREVASLRRNPLVLENLRLHTGENPLAGRCGRSLELGAEFRVPSGSSCERFGFKVFKDKSGWDIEIGYDVNNREVYMERRSGPHVETGNFERRYTAPLAPTAQGNIQLRVFIDVSTVEVFAGGGLRVIQNIVFPPAAADGLDLFCSGGEVTVNRLELHDLDTVWRSDEEMKNIGASQILMPDELTLPVGAEHLFSARMFPENKASSAIAWSIDDHNIAEIRAEGLRHVRIVPKKAGDAILKATISDSTSVAECKLKVDWRGDFRSNIPRWFGYPSQGEWEFAQEGYRGSASAQPTWSLGEGIPPTGDFQMSCMVKSANGKAGLLIQSNPFGHCAGSVILLDFRDGKVSFSSLDGKTVFGEESVPLDAGNSHHLEFSVAQLKPVFRVDGKAVLTTLGNIQASWQNNTGLAIVRGSAVFQDVKLTSLSETKTAIQENDK